MQLILVRHGKPEVPDNGPTSDPPLGTVGIEQAERAARILRHEPIERIVSSGMRRADATAAPLADYLNLPVEIVPDLGEIDRWGGRYASIEMLRAEGGDTWAQFKEDPLGFFGVDPAAFRAAVLSGFTSVLAGQERKVAVFTHGFPINIVLAHALSIAHDARFVPGYASFTRLAGRTIDALTVVSINESGHLADLPADVPAEILQ
jgi:broad specificity phosphatase PhoE